jgi:hypothetical protein
MSSFLKIFLTKNWSLVTGFFRQTCRLPSALIQCVTTNPLDLDQCPGQLTSTWTSVRDSSTLPEPVSVRDS